MHVIVLRALTVCSNIALMHVIGLHVFSQLLIIMLEHRFKIVRKRNNSRSKCARLVKMFIHLINTNKQYNCSKINNMLNGVGKLWKIKDKSWPFLLILNFNYMHYHGHKSTNTIFSVICVKHNILGHMCQTQYYRSYVPNTIFSVICVKHNILSHMCQTQYYRSYVPNTIFSVICVKHNILSQMC